MRKQHADRFMFADAAARRELLLRQWPGWASDYEQYRGYLRWREAIYHYFLRGASLRGLAEKLDITFDAAHSLVRNIRRASKGRRCRDGKTHTVKRGRPFGRYSGWHIGSKTHGASDTTEYSAWAAMRHRCTNPTNKDWANYGGRGITVCKRWEQFENFLADMGKKPSPELSLDRWPDNDGNYEPGNCRWATPSEQSLNTRRNRK